MTFASGSISSITSTPVAGGTGHLLDHSNIRAVLDAHDSILSNSASLAAAVVDETGTGSLVFSNNPTFSGSITAASLVLSGTASILNNVGIAGANPATGNLVVKTATDQQVRVQADGTWAEIASTNLAGSAWRPLEISSGSMVIRASGVNGIWMDSSGNTTIKSASITAGTATTPPILLSVGTNLSSPVQGAIEYDGVSPYFTTNTGAASRGILPTILFRTASAAQTYSNTTAAQALFPTNGTLNVAASTTYEFEMNVAQAGTPSVAVNMSLLFAGTAGINSIFYNAVNSLSTFGVASSVYSAATTATQVTASSTISKGVLVKGLLRTTTAGTIIPQVQFSAFPGAATTLAINSYMKFIPMGASVTSGTNGWS